MRIGIFTDTYLPYVSGLVTSELMLKNALEEMGHEVFIVTANLENFKFVKEDKLIKISGLPIGIYDARLTGIYSFNATSEIKAVEVISAHIRNKNLISRLKYHRLKNDFSQKELSEESGVSLRMIQQYEQRKKDINMASTSSLYSLARVLNCQIENLMEVFADFLEDL